MVPSSTTPKDAAWPGWQFYAAVNLGPGGGLWRDLPAFNVNTLVGQSVDVFHKNPAHQRNMLANLRSTYNTEIKVGKLSFQLIANPIVDAEGNRVGLHAQR